MDIKERFYQKLQESREQLDELTGYRKKKLFGKDPIGAVSKRAVDRMKVMPKNEKEKAQNAKSSKILRWAADRSDERPLDEEQLNELRRPKNPDKGKKHIAQAAKAREDHEAEQLDELRGYRKKKLFGKDPLVAVANRAINRMKLPPHKGKLSPEELKSNRKNRKVSQMAFDRMPD